MLKSGRQEKTMAWAFDTLGYAKRLRDAGVPGPQAEGHAEAAREFIMTELVTKHDLLAVRQDLQETEVRLKEAMNALEARLEARIDTQTLRLTVRLGGIVAAGIGILALIERLH
jgi:hypothetical protein